MPRPQQAALRALELDPGIREAHATLGLIAFERRDWSNWIAELHRAIELRPDCAMSCKWPEHLGDPLVAFAYFERACATQRCRCI